MDKKFSSELADTLIAESLLQDKRSPADRKEEYGP